MSLVFLSIFIVFAFDAQGRHLSKTFTIVMMSAAPEQKKKHVDLDVPLRQHEVKPVICHLTARQHNGDRKALSRRAPDMHGCAYLEGK